MLVVRSFENDFPIAVVVRNQFTRARRVGQAGLALLRALLSSAVQTLHSLSTRSS